MNIMKLCVALACAAMFAASGCVQSLHPLYTNKDLVFEPGLVGTWASESGNLWIFLKSGEKSYELVYTEKGTPAKFSAHLVRLGKFLFLDLFPESPDLKNDLQRAHIMNTHTFSRVWLGPDTLHMTMLEHDWLKKMIDRKKVRIKHERVEDRIVLTATTRDLQQFVLKYAENKEAFPHAKTSVVRQK